LHPWTTSSGSMLTNISAKDILESAIKLNEFVHHELCPPQRHHHVYWRRIGQKCNPHSPRRFLIDLVCISDIQPDI
jgi:hypothetical protein